MRNQNYTPESPPSSEFFLRIGRLDFPESTGTFAVSTCTVLSSFETTVFKFWLSVSALSLHEVNVTVVSRNSTAIVIFKLSIFIIKIF